MSRYVAVIDQGTTSTHCMLFDRRGEVAAAHRLEYQQILPQPGWVEHDPIELWHRTQQVVVGALQCVRIALVWNSCRGRPYHNAIVWQDTRTDALGENGVQDRFCTQTSLPLTNCVPTGQRTSVGIQVWILVNALST